MDRANNSYTIGTNNQMAIGATYAYLYDEEGNRIQRTHQTTDATTRYEWDHRNRLIKVTEHADSDPATLPSKIVEYVLVQRDVEFRRAGVCGLRMD